MRTMLAAVALCALALTLLTGPALSRTDGPDCSRACIEQSKERKRAEVRKANRAKRRRQWRYWTRQPIAQCTWLGESGPPRPGHGKGLQEFARWRYTVPNSQGSGAYGKYQMMPGTYAAFAKYHDWSRLDQEIAAHRLYRAQGTAPWSAC